jgi:hypothetical protein
MIFFVLVAGQASQLKSTCLSVSMYESKVGHGNWKKQNLPLM